MVSKKRAACAWARPSDQMGVYSVRSVPSAVTGVTPRLCPETARARISLGSIWEAFNSSCVLFTTEFHQSSGRCSW